MGLDLGLVENLFSYPIVIGVCLEWGVQRIPAFDVIFPYVHDIVRSQ